MSKTFTRSSILVTNIIEGKSPLSRRFPLSLVLPKVLIHGARNILKKSVNSNTQCRCSSSILGKSSPNWIAQNTFFLQFIEAFWNSDFPYFTEQYYNSWSFLILSKYSSRLSWVQKFGVFLFNFDNSIIFRFYELLALIDKEMMTK